MAACLKSDCSLSRSELLEAVKALGKLLPRFPKLLLGELGSRDFTGAILEEDGAYKDSRLKIEADVWTSALACFKCLSVEEVRNSIVIMLQSCRLHLHECRVTVIMSMPYPP